VNGLLPIEIFVCGVWKRHMQGATMRLWTWFYISILRSGISSLTKLQKVRMGSMANRRDGGQARSMGGGYLILVAENALHLACLLVGIGRYLLH